MKDEITIAFVGTGGDGAVAAGDIVAAACAADGLHVIKTEAYGPQIRGGESSATVRISAKPIHAPADLVDVLLLKESLGDLAALRSVCVSVFVTRGTHAWPPQLTIQEHWRDEFGRLVSDYGVTVEDLEDGVRDAQDVIRRIDSAKA